MAMTLPELYNKSNDITVNTTKTHLKKYQHLINWNDGESIMDLGIGDGNCTMFNLKPILPLNYKEFVGMDVSHSMLEYAKSNINIPRSTFVHFDMGSENAKEEFLDRFDHIFSFYCIHMIQNTRQVFKNIYKMLKPGGQIFLSVMEYSCADPSFDKLNKHPKWGKYGNQTTVSPFYYASSPEQEYKKLLEDAGFKAYTFKTEVISYNMGNEDKWKKFCLAINPLIAKIPAQEQEEYKRDYLEEMKSNFTFSHKNNEQIITSEYNMFIIIANK